MYIPLSTYRFQLNRNFDLKKLKANVKYLEDLNINTIYASPVFKAQKGSLHGYDIIDPNSINEEIGDISYLRSLLVFLKKKGIGWVQDIVPNHMAYSSQNDMLMDIFEKGKNSSFIDYFDIEWDHPYMHIKGKVIAPFLGSFYATALNNGELNLVYSEKGLFVKYYENLFPLSLRSYETVFMNKIELLKEKLGEDSLEIVKFIGVIKFLTSFSDDEEKISDSIHIHPAKAMLWDIYSSERQIRAFMDNNLVLFNTGSPDGSWDLMDELLSRQIFKLCFWKFATEEINYRRFFTVNGLISVKIQQSEVFDHHHDLLFTLCEEGLIDGVRVDHVDGLWDPTTYLQRLRNRLPDKYVTVEKILESNEQLTEKWPIEGTTGYDYMFFSNNVFIKNENEQLMTEIYNRFTGSWHSVEELLYSRKRIIITKHMAGDIDNLAIFLKKISEKDRYGRDITLYGLKNALVEIITYFPVYRTYIDSQGISDSDRYYINMAVRKALDENPSLYHEIGFIQKFILPEDDNKKELDIDRNIFAMKIQQFTAPIVAKGLEDTFFYIYNRLTSLNEVGGNPLRFGVSKVLFNGFIKKRMKRHPYSINATSTHDTKRGEDVRARLNVLSEIPHVWDSFIKKASKINESFKGKRNGIEIPDKNDEYLIYQTLAGTFRCGKKVDDKYIKRIKDYIVKAIREAKVHTAWISNDDDYETSCLNFVDYILSDKENFLPLLNDFVEQIAVFGFYNSISQTILKNTLPGIPDYYQGSELWEFSLVDPDNRNVPDFSKRKRYIKELDCIKDHSEWMKKNIKKPYNGKIKMYIISRLLKLRKEIPSLFLDGDFKELEIHGDYSENIYGFKREYEKYRIIVLIPLYCSEIISKKGVYNNSVFSSVSLMDEEGEFVDVLTEKKIFLYDGIGLDKVLCDCSFVVLKENK